MFAQCPNLLEEARALALVRLRATQELALDGRELLLGSIHCGDPIILEQGQGRHLQCAREGFDPHLAR